MKKYITHSLDVAGYLYSQGLDCKIKKHGVNMCDYIYTDERAGKLIEKFMKGEVVINLHKYIYSRDVLKKRSNLMPVDYTRKNKMCGLQVGELYWFILNGVPQMAHYSEKQPHIGRVSEGNYFKSKEQAKQLL